MSHFNSLTVCGVLLVTTMVPAVADAQPTGHALEVFGTLGVGRVYLDTSALDHTVAGGGARFRLSRRFAVQGDWLAILKECPIKMDDVPRRRRKLPRRRKL